MTPEEREERQAALTAIAGALTEQEAETIMDRMVASTPSFHGTAADLLSLTDRTNGYTDLTRNFYTSIEQRKNMTRGWGLHFAVLAMCMLGEEFLTVMNVMKLMLRAHLLPGEPIVLIWRHHSTPPMRAVTAHVAEGEEWQYLVTQTWDGRVLLCRWHKNRKPTDLDAMRQAVETAIEVVSVTDGQQTADLYERGQDVPWFPAWCHPGRPAQRVTTEG